VPKYFENPQLKYSGEAEIQGWLEGLVGLHASINLKACEVDGENVSCEVQYADDALRVVGVTNIEGELVMKVSEGAITTYAFAPTAESVAQVQAAAAAVAPAPSELPISGGRPSYGFLILLVLGGVLLASGLVLRARMVRVNNR
jgi:hypothetical protein